MNSDINIIVEIEKLIEYALSKNFIHEDDICLIRNQLFGFLQISTPYYETDIDKENIDRDNILNNILQYLDESNPSLVESVGSTDRMKNKIMGIIAPRPSEVNKEYKKRLDISTLEATEYLYNLYLDLNYINESRMLKRTKWQHEEEYGVLDLSIVYTEPEKIHRKRSGLEPDGYPKCGLCAQVVGSSGLTNPFYGENLRTVKMEFCGESFNFGYAMQAYYDEQCILSTQRHERLKISEKTFQIILSFVDFYPHYFLGVNADLPSIGTAAHGRFYGGCSVMPVEYAKIEESFVHPDFEDVTFNRLNWPIPTIRLEGICRTTIAKAAEHINQCWKAHPLFSDTNEISGHNAVAAVGRKNIKGEYQLDIFLRNNSDKFNTQDEHKDVKKSIIGIYDLMGLFIMDSKISQDILRIISYLLNGKEYVKGAKGRLDEFADWIAHLQDKYGIIESYERARSTMMHEIAVKFVHVLENCGVFKQDDEGRREFRNFLFTSGLKSVD